MITNKTTKHLLACSVCCCITATTTSCSDEDYLGGHFTTDGAGVEMHITAQAPEGTTWTEGQIIGLSTSYANNDASARNRQYACEADGQSFSNVTGNPVYLKGLANVVAYFPYQGNDGAEPGIELNTLDQTAIAPIYFAKTDSVGISQGSHVHLQFHPALAQLRLAITAPAGETIKSCRLVGLSHQAEVNPFTFEMKYYDPDEVVIAGEDLTEATFSLIPQTVSAEASLPPHLVLVGQLRSYTVSLGDVALGFGQTVNRDIDVTTGIGALSFRLNDTGFASTTDDGSSLSTTFAAADQAVLYAVKNGQVVLSNVLLTCDANGFWSPNEPIEASGELEGAQFYAYYPYSDNATFDAAAANPFQALSTATKALANQSAKALYEAADLMVTKMPATIGQYNTVTLAMQHQKALLCVELPNTSYLFTNEGMEPYVLSKTEDVEFTLGGDVVQPYFDDATQSYRLIVEPGLAEQLECTFVTNGEDRFFRSGSLQAMQGGQMAKFVVDGGAQLTTITLQVGDYYLADGRILSKDTPSGQLPDNVVGIVVKKQTTQAIRSANAAWSHGVVLCIDESAKKTAWADSRANDIPSGSRWFDAYGLAPEYGTNASNFDEELMAEQGYELTQAWLKVPQSLAIDGMAEPVDLVSAMKEMLSSFETDYPTPRRISTGWFVPSMKEWQNIEKNYALIAAQLEAAGGTPLRWDGNVSNSRYWTPNLRDRRSMWSYVGNKTELGDRYKAPVLSDSSPYYRFLVAF